MTYSFIISQPNVSFPRRKKASFAVGHMGLAYLLAKASGKLLKVNFNIPLVLVLSIIPDSDIIFQFLFGSNIHRGPTHSITVAILVFIPVFIIYRKKATPYFAALASHSLIGDFFIGGQIQLFWPLSTQEFGLPELGFPYISIDSPINVALELTIFVIATVFMFKTRDIYTFFRKRKLNLVLAVPIFTVLLPTFVGYPLQVPSLMVLPHLFYLVLFAIAVLIVLKDVF
jgi:membrane-bound metal-dependent hydrolase YbcI (DUF457 family)